MTAYPLLQILLYLSILFAPPDATQITLSGEIGRPVSLTREAGGSWKLADQPISISNGHVLQPGVVGHENTDVTQFVPANLGPFWEKTPALQLPGGGSTKLKKVEDGFVLYINADTPAEHPSRIIYEHPGSVGVTQASSIITVNVLGEVNRPGTYPISAVGALLDAIAAAGGWTSKADLRDISVLHGAPGQQPVVKRINGKAILDGTTSGPVLEAHDTVYLKESVY